MERVKAGPPLRAARPLLVSQTNGLFARRGARGRAFRCDQDRTAAREVARGDGRQAVLGLDDQLADLAGARRHDIADRPELLARGKLNRHSRSDGKGTLALGRAAACKGEHPAADHAATIRGPVGRAIGRTGDVTNLACGPGKTVTRGADGRGGDIANGGGGPTNRAAHGIGPDQLRIRAARSRGTCRTCAIGRGVARLAAQHLAGRAIEAGIDTAIDGDTAAAAVDRLIAAGRGFAAQSAARARTQRLGRTAQRRIDRTAERAGDGLADSTQKLTSL